MKKVVAFTVVLLSGVCFADSLSEGEAALTQHDYSKALDQLAKACDSGNAKGCLSLGAMYEKGEGVAQNKYKASTLYAQACRAKESLGCANMALSYDTP